MNNIILPGMLVKLKLLEQHDIEHYINQLSPQVMAALQIEDKNSERQYLQSVILENNKTTLFFVILENLENRLIGAIEIRGQDCSRGQLYTWLHHDYWGTGHFQEALQLACREYFSFAKALFFDAHVNINNVRSYKALKKAGFADYKIIDGPHGKQYVLIKRRQQ